MRLYKGKRKLKRKTPLPERVRKSLERLPKWRQKYLFETEEEKKFLVNQMVFNVLDVKALGKKVNIQKALMRQSQNIARKSGEETLRIIYRKFRQELYFYLTYKRNMTKLGLPSEAYFYKNSEMETEGYITTVNTSLPNGFDKEGSRQLIIEFNWQSEEISLIYFD